MSHAKHVERMKARMGQGRSAEVRVAVPESAVVRDASGRIVRTLRSKAS